MMRLTIFARLALGYLVILLIVVALGVYTGSKLDEMSRIIHSISATDSETISIANRLRDAVLSQSALEKKYIVSKDKDFYLQFREGKRFIEKTLSQLTPLLDTKKKKRLVAEVKKSHASYCAMVKKEAQLIQSDPQYSGGKYEKPKDVLINHMTNNLEDVIEAAEAAMDSKIEMSGRIGSQASSVTAILTIGSGLIAVLIAFFNAVTINRPISRLIKGTREIARGRFEKQMAIPSPPEINELAEAFNHMCARLKESDEMKADLISRISHELKTPLAAIREAVSLHRDGIAAESEETQNRIFGIIEEEVERLIASVNKILDLSRMEAGMMEYHMEEYSLAHLIEMSVSKVNAIAGKKGISLETDVDPDLPHAYIDVEKIENVLDNLIGNALKFTPEQGRVLINAWVREGRTSMRPAGAKNRFIKVSISDTGPGIPEESIDSVFDKYKKLHGNGSGLGLHIAKQIVVAHGGDIWVESGEQNGSTFCFTVPVFSSSS